MMFVEVINFPNLTLISPFVCNPYKARPCESKYDMVSKYRFFRLTFYFDYCYYMVASHIWG